MRHSLENPAQVATKKDSNRAELSADSSQSWLRLGWWADDPKFSLWGAPPARREVLEKTIRPNMNLLIT